jgi:hypothetical protein
METVKLSILSGSGETSQTEDGREKTGQKHFRAFAEPTGVS